MHTSISQDEVHGKTKPNQSNPEFLISKCRSPMLKYAICLIKLTENITLDLNV